MRHSLPAIEFPMSSACFVRAGLLPDAAPAPDRARVSLHDTPSRKGLQADACTSASDSLPGKIRRLAKPAWSGMRARPQS